MSNRDLSKYLSLVLRHDPSKAGLSLEAAGWVVIDELLVGVAQARPSLGVNRAKLEAVVRDNDKQRFEISEDGHRIRARQGHSVGVALGYAPREPPDILYHGTAEHSLISIREQGLLKMSRHAVHLSPDRETATRVGARHGEVVVLEVQAKRMHDEGFVFYLTGNNVWYTDHVPPKYLVEPENSTG